MKAVNRSLLPFFLLVMILVNYSCGDTAIAKTSESPTENVVISEEAKVAKKPVSEDFKSYWYAGDAEITSYKLQQARYGELREGNAVLVYVTEPFLPEVQVKANGNGPKNVSVLKLNSTKKYLTGIYPYSIMSSTFYPVHDHQHAIKTSTSVQEWCGHVYSQINNREQFEFESHSYFEGEGDQKLSMDKSWMENEIWTKIRINPAGLPEGEIEIIPSLEYIRTGHKQVKPYKAVASLSTKEGINTYTLDYKDLNRTLSIDFDSAFPYSIEGWTETFRSGYGPNAKVLTSRAVKNKVLKTPYWRQNGTEDEVLRKELGL